jgi:Protein of unknown function (DUF4058)
MPSPFPGMDPYLEDEQLWPVFQHWLVTCLYQILLPGVVDRFHARITQRQYHVEQASDAAATPGNRQEPYVEIAERIDGNLITVLDVVSPANKTTAPGRVAYLETRRQAKAQGASIVEIDLVLQGKPMLDYSRDGLPDWDYAVTVTRATQADRFEIYTSTLQKKLPRFGSRWPRMPATRWWIFRAPSPARTSRPTLAHGSTTSMIRSCRSAPTIANGCGAYFKRRSCGSQSRPSLMKILRLRPIIFGSRTDARRAAMTNSGTGRSTN